MIALDVNAGFLSCLLLGTVTQVSFLISVTPGSLGMRQVLVGAAAVLMDFEFELGVFASGLDHAVVIIIEVIVGLPSVLMLFYTKRSWGND